MSAGRRVMLYIAASLDGYIAKPNDDLSFLSVVEQEGEDYGYKDFVSQVDTVIMGRKTYDWIMKQVEVFPHNEQEVYVITRSARPEIGNTRFYKGDLNELLVNLRGKQGKNIFIDGGAELVNELLKLSQIDDYIISIVPVLLGGGVRLFNEGRPEQNLKLISAKHFRKGLIQLHYQRIDTK